MFGRHFFKQRPGQPIAARTINRPAAELQRQSHPWTAAPLGSQSLAGGQLARTSPPVELWAKITSGSNPYNFSEVYPTASGGWSTLPSGLGIIGTNAYEVNGNTSVTASGAIFVRIRLSAAGDFRFDAGSCP